MAPKGLPEKDELLRAMKGQSVTKNWDVIVSYSTLQLNKALAVLWKKSKTFTGIKLERNFALLRAKVRYTLTLGSPSMEFLTTGAATAVLNMPIVGWVETFMGDSTTPAMKVEIPPGAYEIQVTVPLVSVSGDVQTESIYKAAKVAEEVVFLDTKPNATSNIIFHFANGKDTKFMVVDVRPAGTPDPSGTADLLKEANETIQNWFQDPKNVNAIDYAIAKVSNVKADKVDDQLLRPKSFVFNSHGEGKNAVLSIYIQTEGSGADPGIPNPSFQPTEKNTNNIVTYPIPSGYQASIIIRHDLFLQKYLVPQLETALKTKDIQSPVKVIAADEGFKFELKIGRDFKKELGQRGLFATLSEKDFKFSLKDNPITLTITDGKAKWQWDFKTSVDWSLTVVGGKSSGGTNDVHVTVNKESSITDLTQSAISMKLDLSGSDFKVDVTAQQMPWLARLGGATQSISSDLANAKVTFDPITVAMNGVDFLAAQNVFAPDRNIIKIDTSAGILTPYDVVLLGQIVQPT